MCRLTRADGAVDVGDRLVLGRLADEDLAVLGERDDRRGGARALGVRDDRRLAALQDGDDGVGGAEVDSDRSSHGVDLSHLGAGVVLVWESSALAWGPLNFPAHPNGRALALRVPGAPEISRCRRCSWPVRTATAADVSAHASTTTARWQGRPQVVHRVRTPPRRRSPRLRRCIPLLRAAAERQLGLFTAADARRAGYEHAEIRQLCASGPGCDGSARRLRHRRRPAPPTRRAGGTSSTASAVLLDLGRPRRPQPRDRPPACGASRCGGGRPGLVRLTDPTHGQ